MQLGNQDIERLANEGLQALRQGRAAEARSRFEAITAIGRANAQIWLLLAIACRAQKDAAAEEAALDQLLSIAPQTIRGLIMKGDCRVHAGDERKAADFYRKALHLAEGQSLAQADIDELHRAEGVLRQLDAGNAARLEAALEKEGMGAGQRSPRFQRSLDIMSGRTKPYFQEPTGYYFPELPQIQFYDPQEFGWAASLEAKVDDIRRELLSVFAADLEGFRPYIRAEENQPRDHPLLDKKDWSALFLCENGKRFDEAIARCPQTWAAVQAAPLPLVERSSPTVMFSLLRAGARIPAHRGVHNARLTCHLPLIVPSGCGFRVGNEVREWQEGKLLIFDDSIEHEAWNEGSEDRVVLIFDIWRPELTEKERREITALFTLAIQ